MWYNKSMFYHIYPLGFCGAPFENKDEAVVNRISKVEEWIPHFKELGINAIYFGPIFKSSTHGYDTTDYAVIDNRLGTNEDFAKLCKALHKANIKVVVDGVFNHVGRQFWAFEDVKKNRDRSAYKDWFVNVNFGGNSNYNDGFYYEGWEGHYELVKLNLYNEAVKNHLYDVVRGWVKEFDIDGIRLDVAYSLEENFMKGLRHVVDAEKKDFWLMGEIIHGDANRIMNDQMLNSATNYECYKGIYSSHNDKNYFEINYSMNRLFGNGGIYKGKHMYNFVDNHDVTRIASILKNKHHLDNVYTLLFTMPGIPSVYYGSEWKLEGIKQGRDQEIRPSLELDEMLKRDQKLVKHIRKLAAIKNTYEPLEEGGYQEVIVRNEQLIFKRESNTGRILVGLNLSDHAETYRVRDDEGQKYINVLNDNQPVKFENGEYVLELKECGGVVLVPEAMFKANPLKEADGESVDVDEDALTKALAKAKAKKLELKAADIDVDVAPVSDEDIKELPEDDVVKAKTGEKAIEDFENIEEKIITKETKKLKGEVADKVREETEVLVGEAADEIIAELTQEVENRANELAEQVAKELVEEIVAKVELMTGTIVQKISKQVAKAALDKSTELVETATNQIIENLIAKAKDAVKNI